MILPEQYLTRSETTLAAARSMHDAGFTLEAVSRGYYAAFYATNALLASEGIQLNKHSAVVARYGLLYARTAVLDPRATTGFSSHPNGCGFEPTTDPGTDP